MRDGVDRCFERSKARIWLIGNCSVHLRTNADDANNGAVIRVWRLFKPAFVKGTLSRSTRGTFSSLISQFVSNVKRRIDELSETKFKAFYCSIIFEHLCNFYFFNFIIY